MNTLGWIMLLVPPILAGIVAAYFAVRRDTPISALNRGVYITWGLGIVLGFVTSIVVDLIYPDPGKVSGAFLAVIMQAVVSLIAGIAVGAACALWVRARSGQA
jgi:hypothetical protein